MTDQQILPIYFLLDCSHSMSGSKIDSLNEAVVYALDSMKQHALIYPNLDVLVKVVAFDYEINATPFDLLLNFEHKPLRTGSSTNMGGAISYVTDDLETTLTEAVYMPPVIILVTDGHPDYYEHFDEALNSLLEQKHGQGSIRLAIGIGEDVNYFILRQFIGNDAIPVLQANNGEDLTKFMQWVRHAIGGGIAGLLAATVPASSNGKDW